MFMLYYITYVCIYLLILLYRLVLVLKDLMVNMKMIRKGKFVVAIWAILLVYLYMFCNIYILLIFYIFLKRLSEYKILTVPTKIQRKISLCFFIRITFFITNLCCCDDKLHWEGRMQKQKQSSCLSTSAYFMFLTWIYFNKICMI